MQKCSLVMPFSTNRLMYLAADIGSFPNSDILTQDDYALTYYLPPFKKLCIKYNTQNGFCQEIPCYASIITAERLS